MNISLVNICLYNLLDINTKIIRNLILKFKYIQYKFFHAFDALYNVAINSFIIDFIIYKRHKSLYMKKFMFNIVF